MGVQFDPPSWLAQLGTLVTAGGGSVVVVKLIEKAFSRADRRDDLAVGLRTSILERLDKLEKSNAEKDTALEAMRLENTRLQIRVAQAEEREVWVRNRYHRLMNWMQEEPRLPAPPSYLFEDVPGDTTEGSHWPPRKRPEKTEEGGV